MSYRNLPSGQQPKKTTFPVQGSGEPYREVPSLFWASVHHVAALGMKVDLEEIRKSFIGDREVTLSGIGLDSDNGKKVLTCMFKFKVPVTFAEAQQIVGSRQVGKLNKIQDQANIPRSGERLFHAQVKYFENSGAETDDEEDVVKAPPAKKVRAE